MISIVVPTFNEEGNVEILFDKIKSNLKKEKLEVIFVDDGSTDGSLDILKSMAAKHDEVKYISFSRNFGHQAALRAGLKSAKGDAVISMDADLQHPPELLPKLILEWKNGYEIVYTKRDDSKAEKVGAIRKKSSVIFYGLINYLSGLSIDPGAADFRLLDRRVLDVINDFPEPNLFLRGLVNWVGFKTLAIEYIPAKRFTGSSKYSIKKLFNLAINGITQFSVKPLRISIVVGFIMAAIGALYGGYALVEFFLRGSSITSGWTSLIIIILLTSGIQLILLGVVGEYVGKTFQQTKQRPDYIIARTNISEDKGK